MIRIALVEDDAGYRRELKSLLERYGRESGEKFDIRTFSDGDEIAVGYKAEYDIILMDIQMRFMNGMDAAKEIREKDGEVIIIFVTNTAQYAISGYEVNALDYILKPVSYYAFSKTLERAIGSLRRREKRYIFITNQHGVKKVEESRILYIEVEGHSLVYHTLDGDFGATGTMKEVEEKVSQESFFRCNKCFLVNLENVDAVEGDDAVVGGERVALSRNKKKAFMEALSLYVMGRS
ncbi:MAG: response regulator transcription factor [Oscillospiraceae bacterium]|nr:response regulator transcription factor [Oscillospiraceae bacterium]